MSSASAQTIYPWCVQYTGGEKGIGATSCSFVSRDQCMMTARGTGADCVENPASLGAGRPAKKTRRL
jgi:hypothetical protein